MLHSTCKLIAWIPQELKALPISPMGRKNSTSRQTDTIKILLHKFQHVCLYLNKNWSKGKKSHPSRAGRAWDGSQGEWQILELHQRHLELPICRSSTVPPQSRELQQSHPTTPRHTDTHSNAWHFSGSLLKNRPSVIPKQISSSWSRFFRK